MGIYQKMKEKQESWYWEDHCIKFWMGFYTTWNQINHHGLFHQIVIDWESLFHGVHWNKSDNSTCRTQVRYAYDIPCPLHFSSQHDISHFLLHVMWRIELNPLGHLVFSLGQRCATVAYQIAWFVQYGCMTCRYTADPTLTATSLLCLYMHTYTIILYIII